MANKAKAPVGKNSASYWLGKVFKPVNARGEESPHYNMKVAFKGRRMSFSTGTGNKDAAARLAAAIYNDLLVLGVEAALQKHRPKKSHSERVATVGEWLSAVQRIAEIKESTLNDYAQCLRQIAGEIKGIQKSESRYDPIKGGAAAYKASIGGLSLDIITLDALQKWRLAYIKKAKTPLEEKSRKTSCNTIIRQASSLFSGKVTYFLKDLQLPTPRPFEIPVELKNANRGNHPLYFPRQNSRYHSKIDARSIVHAAHTELSSSKPNVFLAFLLAIGAGLRRGEIDTLVWDQVDCHRGVIQVEATDDASLKTSDSQAEVEIDEQTSLALQGFRAKASGKFVVESEGKKGKKSRRSYRANKTFSELIGWLRNKGVKAQKPIQELRKEIGALATQEHGIYVASRFLRHSNVSTTNAHYVDKKDRKTVAIGSWLMPSNVVPMVDPKKQGVKPAKKRNLRRGK